MNFAKFSRMFFVVEHIPMAASITLSITSLLKCFIKFYSGAFVVEFARVFTVESFGGNWSGVFQTL